MNTRYATLDDIGVISSMYLKARSDLKDVLHEGTKAEKIPGLVEKYMEQAPCILLEKEGEIIGFWGLTTLRSDASDIVLLSDYMCFIKKKHRSYGAIKALTKAVKDTADHFDIPLRIIYHINGRLEAHIRLMESMGIKAVGIAGYYKGK